MSYAYRSITSKSETIPLDVNSTHYHIVFGHNFVSTSNLGEGQIPGLTHPASAGNTSAAYISISKHGVKQ